MNENRDRPTHRRSGRVLAAAFSAASILFFARCGNDEPKPTVDDPETTPTQVSYNHRRINSVNGDRQYRMETPLLERYELAKEPFMEFREGIKVETFDSALQVESDIVADYARFNETQKFWEARGNVIAHNYEAGKVVRTLLTERLFWDQTARKIYSDTIARVIDGGSVHVGRNFEADESFERWSFRNTVGQIEVDAAAMRDTSAAASSPVAADTSAIK
ncbi:LPS export ABC transporter periplasmic protein LptC [uncultured Rikenella sp.]|uniref:LPS export ABC transporter periplasmic protein LptC n=1 Tax=uncultured Rikenella sp. TaxID=368003 RepID=UPI0025DFE898|nr:LPS export ABC transporter periplasmic protein LptC [uncultured Rikenella sp.]